MEYGNEEHYLPHEQMPLQACIESEDSQQYYQHHQEQEQQYIPTNMDSLNQEQYDQMVAE